MNKKLFLSGLVACCFCLSTFATRNIYVKASTGSDNLNGTSWNTAFKTLKKAVESVNPNEETVIYLEPNAVFDTGGTIVFGDNLQLSIIGDNTTIRAAEKPGIEGAGLRIFRLMGENIYIKGIAFLNGRQTGYYSGGAIFFDGNTLTIDSCKFVDNEAGSGGGAIGSRGKNLIVRNSYFEGNYLFAGGSGPAIVHSGKKDDSIDNSLVVENSTFYKNYMPTFGTGTAIALVDRSQQPTYTNVQSVKIVNCTFLENKSNDPYQAAIDMTDNDKTKAHFINNTFYKEDGALRIGDIYGEEGGEVLMINNLIIGEKAGVFGAQGTMVADLRSPIIAYNNIIVGKERGVNEYIDDECFNDKKAQYNNVVELLSAYPLSNISLATSLSRDNFVPYLPLTAGNSDAVNGGYTGSEYADLIPTADIRGLEANGTRDIGAFEYDGRSGIFAPKAEVADFFTIIRSTDVVILVNTSDRSLNLNVLDVTGRVVYTGVVEGTLSISKQELGTSLAVFVLTDGVNTKAQKVVL